MSSFLELGADGAGLDRVLRLAAESERPGRTEALALLAIREVADAPLRGSLASTASNATLLVGTREEHFSDWLAWLCEHLGGRVVAEILALTPECFGDGPVEVERELSVAQGHEGQRGRLDLVLRGGSSCVVVELKLTDADAADTAKHSGYSASHVASDRVLLARSGSQKHYGDFRLRTWYELAAALRRSIPQLRDRSPLLAAIAMCFVDAVEERLLGFGPHLAKLAKTGGYIGPVLPRWIDYLRAVEGLLPMSTHGAPADLDAAFADYWSAHVALRSLRNHGISTAREVLDESKARVQEVFGSGAWEVIGRARPETLEAHARTGAWIGARVLTLRGKLRVGIWFFANRGPWAFVELVPNDAAGADEIQRRLAGSPKDRFVEREAGGVSLCATLEGGGGVKELLRELLKEYLAALGR